MNLEVRKSVGVLTFAVLVALVALVVEVLGASDFGALLVFAALLTAVIGLHRLASALLRD